MKIIINGILRWPIEPDGTITISPSHQAESSIECRCETKMLMRRGCDCGAMKAEAPR